MLGKPPKSYLTMILPIEIGPNVGVKSSIWDNPNWANHQRRRIKMLGTLGRCPNDLGCRKLAEKTGYFDAPTNTTWPVHSTIADYRWQHTTEGRALTFTILLLTTEVLPIPGENPRFRFRSWPSPLGGSLGISVGMMEMPKKLLTKAWKSRKLSAEFHRGSR